MDWEVRSRESQIYLLTYLKTLNSLFTIKIVYYENKEIIVSRQLSKTDELENTYVDERVKKLLPIFEALAPYKVTQRKKGVGNLPGWEVLAAQEARLLKINYPDDKPEHEKTYGTCQRQITALKKALKHATKTELKDPALNHQVNTIITNFGNALSYQFTSYKQTQNANYREKVAERSTPEARILIDLTAYLELANSILTKVYKGETVGLDWRDVSCAIALATGRRMGEVHLSASFEQLGDYEVIFKGQLKGKSRKLREKVMIDGKETIKEISLRHYPFHIPTLLPSHLVCHALNWLGERDKRFPPSEDTERVNRRWSKVLNEKAKDWAVIPEMTYHKFRAAYLRASIVNSGVDPFDYMSYAQSILGDDDEGTIKTYQRFGIKPGTLTKI
jgi:hypothetical protein